MFTIEFTDIKAFTGPGELWLHYKEQRLRILCGPICRNVSGKALTAFEGFFQGSPRKQGAFDADGVLANYAEGVEFAQRGVFPVSLASPVAQEGPEAAGEVCYLGDVLAFYGL